MNINNYKGALIGVSVGDALGATTENMWKEDIKKQYGTLTEIIGGGWLNVKAGDITDDTEMTIAVAKGILRAENRNPIHYIGNEFLKWRASQPKDIGTITANALHHYTYRSDWRTASLKTHKILKGKTAGNGSLMRCLPIALAYPFDLGYMRSVTLNASKMTHYDVKAEEACLIYNSIAKRVIDGQELKEAIRTEIKDTRYGHMTRRNPSNRPSGYVVDTFEWVIRVLLTSETYEEVVVRLANEGSDSDTTAAIAGGLAGLYHGFDAIPERFSSKILRKNELIDLAEKLYNRTHDEHDRIVGE